MIGALALYGIQVYKRRIIYQSKNHQGDLPGTINLSIIIQTAEPTEVKRKNLTKLSKEQYFKIYQTVYCKMMIQHRDLIQYLKGKQNINNKDLSLSEQQKQQIKTLIPYFNKILNQQGQITTQVYDAIVKQLHAVLAQRINKSEKQLSERDREQYDCATALITSQYEKRKCLNQAQAPTRYTLFRIDALSLFLRQNHRYKQLINLSSPQQIFTVYNLPKIFNFSKEHIVELIKIYDKVKNWLKYDHWDKLKMIVYIIQIVEQRYKISNFKRRSSKQQTQKIKFQSAKMTSMLFVEEYFSNQNDKQKYRLSEIVFLMFGSRKVQNVGFKIKDQIAVKMNLLNLLDNYEKRIGKLKISLQYNIKIESMMQYIRSIENKERDEDIEMGRKILKDVQKCQWYFIRNNQISMHQAMQKILGFRMKFLDLFNMERKYGFVWKKLYILGMERLKLASMVYKKQMKVLSQFQTKQQIFISKWEYFQNHKAYLPDAEEQKTRSKANNSSCGEKCLTFIMATTDDDKLLFYCKMKNKLKKDRHYLEILSKAFLEIKDNHFFDLNLYQMDYNKRLQLTSQIRLHSYFKRSYRADVYSISSSEKLASHLLANEIISTYALQVNGDDFYDKMERIINRVINNLSIILGWSTNG